MARARLLAVAAAAGVCLLAAAPATAQTGQTCVNPGGAYPVGQRCTGTTSTSTVPPGQPSSMGISTPPVFDANEVVGVTVFSTPQSLGTLVAGSSGAVNATVTLPALDPGQHRLELVGQVSNQLVTIPFTVAGVAGVQARNPAAGGPARVGANGLPLTGRNSTVPLVATGTGLVLVGSLTVASARRRRSGLAV